MVDAVRELHSAYAALTTVDVGEGAVVARAGETPPGDNRQLRIPIDVDGHPWGTLHITWPAALGPISPERPKAFTDLIAAAVANANHRDGLTRSRARVIAAADEARRQLQRDVHDGAQQRLVHTIITLKLARDRAVAGLDVSDLLTEALANAEDANKQLRDIVRGILPAALTRAGLTAAIESLVADTPLPVHLRLDVPRLPVAVETTGYFTVAEAVTNVIKHARASALTITGWLSDDERQLTIVVQDNGVGGADPLNGTGLLGLTDRIEATGGTLILASESGKGTQLTATLPVGWQGN